MAFDPTTSSIYSGIYAAGQAQAQNAYNNALANVQYQKSSLYKQYGLLDTGAIDPNNQFGDTQMLLRNQGAALDSARETSFTRGLGGAGLGQQEGSNLRFAQGAETQQFGNTFTNTLHGYNQQGLDAKDAYNKALYQSMLDAINAAIAAQSFDSNSGGTSGSQLVNLGANGNIYTNSSGQFLPTGTLGAGGNNSVTPAILAALTNKKSTFKQTHYGGF